MRKHIVDEITGIPYTLVGDYYLPWGDLPDDELQQRPIGIWGQRHLRYIKQHCHSIYTELLITGKLNDYLANLNYEAEAMFSRLVKQMAERQGVTEKLKATDQIAWVGRISNIRNAAMEVVNTKLIYT